MNRSGLQPSAVTRQLEHAAHAAVTYTDRPALCYSASGLGQLNICFPQGNNLFCITLREKKLFYFIFHTTRLLFIKTDYNWGSPAQFKPFPSANSDRGQFLITGHFNCQPINLFTVAACLFKEPFGSSQLTCELQTPPQHDSHPSLFDPLLIITFKQLFLDYTFMKNNLCVSQKNQTEYNFQIETVSHYSRVQGQGHRIRE